MRRGHGAIGGIAVAPRALWRDMRFVFIIFHHMSVNRTAQGRARHVCGFAERSMRPMSPEWCQQNIPRLYDSPGAQASREWQWNRAE